MPYYMTAEIRDMGEHKKVKCDFDAGTLILN